MNGSVDSDDSPANGVATIGAVAIGRNEGERLVACLGSIVKAAIPAVYVDSGSTDGSVAAAKKLGVVVVTLDMSIPFTAARARNAGFAELMKRNPGLGFVQFVDGDCELVGGWIGAGAEYLKGHAQAGLVCGRRRERHPERSIYNMLADIEWDRPPGETESFGGDALFRVEAFQAVGGFNDRVICSEDDELSARLRKVGWGIRRIDRDMSIHDANMTRFSQWWRRSVRSGHGFAEVNRMHPEHFAGMPRRIVRWSILVPLAAVLLAGLFNVWAGLVVLGLYPLSFFKICLAKCRDGLKWSVAAIYAASLVLVKFPNMIGMLTYYKRLWRNESFQIIEYK